MTITARTRFFDRAEGGRRHPANQGYRPTMQFDGCRILFAGKITFLDGSGTPYPQGSKVPYDIAAEIRLPNCQLEAANIREGACFRLTGGTYPVAGCLVNSIFDRADYALGT